jgi:hypothetical protein
VIRSRRSIIFGVPNLTTSVQSPRVLVLFLGDLYGAAVDDADRGRFRLLAIFLGLLGRSETHIGGVVVDMCGGRVEKRFVWR